MRILLSVTYYRPHVSGLTIYVERLTHGLARRGHQVTVLTSHNDPTLPLNEMVNGVTIVRVPVIATISKGPIMPRFGAAAAKLARSHDVVSLHLPQVESMLAAVPARAMRKPVVLTYHCDLDLPDGAFNTFVGAAVSTANRATGHLADAVVAYTDDYAQHSPFLRSFRHKIEVIGPPVTMPAPSAADVAAFRERHRLPKGPILGYASRFATEKGIEYAIDAAPALIERYPDLRILFAGPYQEVIGEDDYRARLEPKIRELGNHWQFLGTLGPEELPAFYGSLDALLMTSINSTESFGLVQVEAMLCGTPVVATNLPGVRQPVRITGMGEIIDIGSSYSLAKGILKVLENRQAYVRPREEIAAHYDIDVTVTAYESLFERLAAPRNAAA